VGTSEAKTGCSRPSPVGAALLMCVCVLSVPAAADHLFRSGIMGQLDAAHWARWAMEMDEVVVAGEFVAVCDEEFGTAVVWGQSRYVTARFRVDEAFKGARRGDIVEVQVKDDMLVYPGEDITRYRKRHETHENLGAQIESPLSGRPNPAQSGCRVSSS